MPLDTNLVDRLIAKVKKNVGRPGDTSLDDYVLEHLNTGQKKICNEANFWFMRQSTTINFTQSDNTEALPANFKDEDIVSLQVTSGGITSWEPLENVDYEDIIKDYDATNEGDPSVYTINQKNLIVYPLPDAAKVIRLDYFGYMDNFTEPDGDDNYLITDYPDILEYYATYKCFLMLREFEDAKNHKMLFDQELQDLKFTNADKELPNEFVLKLRPDAKASTLTRPRSR